MFARKRQMAAPLSPMTGPQAGAGHEALRFLTEQRLDHSPANFSMAWRAQVDRHGLIAMAIDSILMDGRMLTQADADRIALAEAERAIKTPPGDDPFQEALRHQTLRLAALASDAAARSQDFGESLSSDLSRLTDEPASLRRVVEEMIERTRTIEVQLRSASKQIEHLRQEVEATRDDAERDALTGLLNRRGAKRELAARDSRSAGVVAVCDVDHFKAVNDEFGHGVGDRVLRGVASSLSDSVGVHPVVRWGGEEFLILMDGLSPATAAALMEQARRDLAARRFRLRDSGESLRPITISVGLALLIGPDAEAAIEAADHMLYAAKRGGRNRVVAAWHDER